MNHLILIRLQFINCVTPENIHISSTEGIFSKTPTPQEIPIPSVGEYGYFLELHIVFNDWYILE